MPPGCRNPDFRLPDLGVSKGISIGQLENRTALLRQLDALRRGIDEGPRAIRQTTEQ